MFPVRCLPPPLVVNTTATFDNNLGRLTLTCTRGHLFPDGFQVRQFTCNSDGSWDSLPSCSGEWIVWRRWLAIKGVWYSVLFTSFILFTFFSFVHFYHFVYFNISYFYFHRQWYPATRWTSRMGVWHHVTLSTNQRRLHSAGKVSCLSRAPLRFLWSAWHRLLGMTPFHQLANVSLLNTLTYLH